MTSSQQQQQQQQKLQQQSQIVAQPSVLSFLLRSIGLSSAPLTNTSLLQNVVVIGAGFGGATLCKGLEKQPGISVTLIEPRDFLLNKFGALRAAAQGGKWSTDVLLPIASILKNTKHVQAKATRIDSSNKNVLCDNGETVSYDVLVICSGSRNFSPGEPPSHARTMESAKAYWRELAASFASGKRFAVVGTGPVAIEMVGEIRLANPTAEVSLLASNYKLLGSVVPAFAPKHVAYIEEQLAALNIKVESGDPVVSPQPPKRENQLEAPPIISDCTVTFQSGKTKKFDALVFALGAVSQASGFCPAEWLDASTGEVLIDELFRVKGAGSSGNVFCFGDAAQILKRSKMGFWATNDAELVLANILAVIKGKAPTQKVQMPRGPLMLLPIGDKHGILVAAYGWIFLGNKVASSLKGKDLAAPKVWDKFGLKVPGPG